jgi:hypothetical protein
MLRCSSGENTHAPLRGALALSMGGQDYTFDQVKPIARQAPEPKHTMANDY